MIQICFQELLGDSKRIISLCIILNLKTNHATNCCISNKGIPCVIQDITSARLTSKTPPKMNLSSIQKFTLVYKQAVYGRLHEVVTVCAFIT
jgi:hypothetical protein